jgi:hypothetical protein
MKPAPSTGAAQGDCIKRRDWVDAVSGWSDALDSLLVAVLV